MEFIDTVKYRQSIRKFSDKQISIDDLTEVVKIAQQAPSWANAQPWKVYIASGGMTTKIQHDHLERSKKGIAGNADFSTIHREQWAPFPRKNMRDWGGSLGNFLGSSADKMSRSQVSLFNAPALVYLTIDRNSPEWAVFDLGMFAQTPMLAAADRKIDSIAAYEIVKYPDSVRKFMDIPQQEILAMGIALGYRDDDLINNFRSERVDSAHILTIKD